eukprot:scaffold3.g6530.t1
MAASRLAMAAGQVGAVTTPAAAAIGPAAKGAAGPGSSGGGRGGGRGRGRGGGRGGRGRGRKAQQAEAEESPSPAAAAPSPGGAPQSYKDPGGRLVWAKVRPFFGTFEFEWIGSKRQLVDWEAGLKQGFDREDDQASVGEAFKAALEEVEAYRRTARLPDVFYVRPPPLAKAKPRGVKRGGRPGGGGGGGARAAALSPAEYAAAVRGRQKRIRQQLGLMPPDDSPYAGDAACPNPNLDALVAEWRTQGRLLA